MSVKKSTILAFVTTVVFTVLITAGLSTLQTIDAFSSIAEALKGLVFAAAIPIFAFSRSLFGSSNKTQESLTRKPVIDDNSIARIAIMTAVTLYLVRSLGALIISLSATLGCNALTRSRPSMNFDSCFYVFYGSSELIILASVVTVSSIVAGWLWLKRFDCLPMLGLSILALSAVVLEIFDKIVFPWMIDPVAPDVHDLISNMRFRWIAIWPALTVTTLSIGVAIHWIWRKMIAYAESVQS